MRSRFQAVALPAEVGEFADDVQQIFRELGRAFGPESLIGECAPALDVYETDDKLEIAMDLPGVDAMAVRIVIRGSAVLIAGEKPARRGQGDSNFHLVERGFGRFVRLVRLPPRARRRRRAPRSSMVSSGSRSPKWPTAVASRSGCPSPHRSVRGLMRLLFIGDIVGKPGRELVRRGLAAIVDEHRIELVIANAENAAAGFGITREIGDQLLAWGVDVMTSGNHIWDKKEAIDYIGAESRLLQAGQLSGRRARATAAISRGRSQGQSVGVINVMGRVFMHNIDDPFAIVQREIDALRQRARVIFVDFHAEATSEKVAMGWFLDGKVTAVVGTHTHVQTADERILPKGTAYLTDVGMTGPHDSVIGVEIEAAVGRFLNAMPVRFETATGNPRLNAVVIEADEQTGRATDIERLSYSLDELLALAGDSHGQPLRPSV